MYQSLVNKEKKLAVIGLGYVGLPLAIEFGKKFEVIGFDINESRVEMIKNGDDPSEELQKEAFEGCQVHFTANAEDLKKANFFIVGVPTPVDQHRVPNLKPLLSASETVGKALKKGDYVVYESTVYPGCTEEECVPILEAESGLKMGRDFKVGYSPERINPGDRVRTLTNITKIVSGSDPSALDEIASIYDSIITTGVYPASSIKVAEAAKVIENAQRDINIAFVNELAIIFDKLGIDTKEVLKAAGTKWNFLPFSPGLVGGHCIGVDPYYLAYKAQQMGYNPQIILGGRRLNDEMHSFIAKKVVQFLLAHGKNPNTSTVLVKGITFKENVSDIRNSKVADLIRELMQYSIHVQTVDPYASPNEVAKEYGISLNPAPVNNYDAVIVAVNHKDYLEHDLGYFQSIMRSKPILIDIKGIYDFQDLNGLTYWRL